MRDSIIFGSALSLLILIMVFTSWFNWARPRNGMEERVEKLEQQMLEKTRPVINVERATIYNTDGEIVLETHERR